MAEAREHNPAVNIQKTTTAQHERVRVAEQPLNLIDRWRGKYTHGSVNSEYERGKGGYVGTEVHSGKATLDQTWRFNKEGELVRVSVVRSLGERDYPFSGGAREKVSEIVLSRDESGRFQVEKSETAHRLPDWVKEFSSASARMEAVSDKPHFSNNPPNKE